MNSKSVIVFSQPPLHCTILLLLRYYYYHVTHIIKNQILYVQNSLDPLCKMTTNNQFATCLDSKTRHVTRAGVRAGGFVGGRDTHLSKWACNCAYHPQTSAGDGCFLSEYRLFFATHHVSWLFFLDLD